MIDSDDDQFDPTEYSATSTIGVPKQAEVQSKRTKEGFYLADPDEMISYLDIEEKVEPKKRRRRDDDSCSEEEVLQGMTMDSF
jgi:hypothetical protein